MEMSHRAIVMAWGPSGRTFWPRSQGSLSDFASQEGAQEALPGCVCTSTAGPGGLRGPLGHSGWEVTTGLVWPAASWPALTAVLPGGGCCQ